jgi:hypothetical protein
MSLFSRRVDVVVVALSWNRTVVIEQGRWRSRRTSWKPHGNNVRNLRVTHETEVDTLSNKSRGGSSRDAPWGKSSTVVAKNTYFEYEELEWRKYRSFSARGEGQAAGPNTPSDLTSGLASGGRSIAPRSQPVLVTARTST